ncbi:MAG TPA: hypothetical protein VEB66_02615 [Opitutaceae bacterium]|nr:hypothetical protein [Opitutaceae bacterium]
MNPDHLIAVVLAVLVVSAFLHDYRSAARPAPVRVRRVAQRPEARD